jgi:hypothetical protein
MASNDNKIDEEAAHNYNKDKKPSKREEKQRKTFLRTMVVKAECMMVQTEPTHRRCLGTKCRVGFGVYFWKTGLDS